MKTKVKSLKNVILGVIVSVTLVAIMDSCGGFEDRLLYAVNESKCTGCAACSFVCPENAISMIDGKAVIDKKKCTGCGTCPESCLDEAIYATTESK